MKRRDFVAASLTGAALPSAAGAAAAGPSKRAGEPASRQAGAAIIREARRIVTPDGVQRLETALGETDNGLLIGVHFIGRMFDEAGLFRLAAASEQPAPGPTDYRTRLCGAKLAID